MRLEHYLTESLNKPYSFVNVRRNVEWDSDNERGKHGATALFKTKDGVYYEITAYRIGWTKEDRERRAREAEKRKEAKAKGKRIPHIFKTVGGIWEVHFNQFKQKGVDPESVDWTEDDWDNTITGTGDAFRVFATVFQFVRDVLVEDKKPSIIALIAKTEEGVRADLYEKLAKRYSGELGYKVKKVTKGKDKTRVEIVKK